MTQSVQSARAAGRVSLAVFLSRILGLVRDQVFAKLFGVGLYNDAWLVAFRIPNLLRDLFAEGALSSAFVPTFTNFLHKKGKSEAWLLANLVLCWMIIILGGLTLVFLIFSEYFVYLLAAGFADSPEKLEVTSVLLKILSPFLMLIGMASVAMGILNTMNYFFIPSLAPAIFNVMVILSGFFLVPQFEEWGLVPIYAMAVGAVAGGFLQCCMQVPFLWKLGYRFQFKVRLNHEGIRKIISLLAPAVVGVGAVQLNILVNTQIASFLQENGPVSWLSYAFRILYLPIGLFGLAMGVVNLREVSKFAALEDWEEVKKTVANSIKLVALMSIPSMVGLIILAVPIVRVLFERGNFTSSDTEHTAYALIFYALGLFTYSCNKIYIPTFYALEDTRTPVRISLIAVGTNLIVNLILVFAILPLEYRYVGLAFGTTLSISLSNILLMRGLKHRLGSFERYRVPPMIIKLMVAAVFMGIVVYGLDQFFNRMWQEKEFMQELVSLISCIAVGIIAYFSCCGLLRVREISYFFKLIRR